MPRPALAQAFCSALLLTALPAFGTVVVGSGSTIEFADAAIDLGCSDLNIAGNVTASSGTLSAIANLGLSGSLAPASGSLSVGGDFSNTGTFTAGASHIAIVDACGSGTSTLTGATTFYDFATTSASGKSLVLPAGITETVAHALTLQGTAGNLLRVQSSSPGVRARLAVTATQTIAYVDARDNQASAATIAPSAAAAFNSVNGGDLINWFVSAVPGTAAVPAPLTPAFGWLLAIILLLAASYQLLKRSRMR